MLFQHELYRGDPDSPLSVLVRADVYRDPGAPGSASYPPGWYCDITSVKHDRREIDITREEEDALK